jgi:hypothetical protein
MVEVKKKPSQKKVSIMSSYRRGVCYSWMKRGHCIHKQYCQYVHPPWCYAFNDTQHCDGLADGSCRYWHIVFPFTECRECGSLVRGHTLCNACYETHRAAKQVLQNSMRPSRSNEDPHPTTNPPTEKTSSEQS